MDTVPYDFIASTLRLKLISNGTVGYKYCQLLGANYGTIASKIAGRFLGYVVTIPGIFGEDPMSESSVFSSAPSFVGLLKREELEDVPHHVDDIVRFTVEAENLFFGSSEIRGKVLSLRRYRSLMHKCRFAAIRGLTLVDFHPDTLDRHFDRFFSMPGLTSFFNRVDLQYQSDASFKRLFLTLMANVYASDIQEDAMDYIFCGHATDKFAF
uniref:COesterase domain-containing protein n=1 Tax=Steinernema glaseri TaxID=37863 RepID=A0A1I7Y8V7_9BILA